MSTDAAISVVDIPLLGAFGAAEGPILACVVSGASDAVLGKLCQSLADDQFGSRVAMLDAGMVPDVSNLKVALMQVLVGHAQEQDPSTELSLGNQLLCAISGRSTIAVSKKVLGIQPLITRHVLVVQVLPSGSAIEPGRAAFLALLNEHILAGPDPAEGAPPQLHGLEVLGSPEVADLRRLGQLCKPRVDPTSPDALQVIAARLRTGSVVQKIGSGTSAPEPADAVFHEYD
ncbi:hypothetical protein H696_04493 [Fonticula alba]|uniref:Uncharacterized protein n=1 Tax=Fonticula alba TaxID=691883 RepID=A0A058Z578_FONAL|nr:hypothetical protein H696_04493 [Fonticula alba]KCV69078.1 hypothetical protein H696_04493 [Fonticula alba]|eukprot:XP_009496649.1 hypothetical protein H696_04493 [Fonticula alba]